MLGCVRERPCRAGLHAIWLEEYAEGIWHPGCGPGPLVCPPALGHVVGTRSGSGAVHAEVSGDWFVFPPVPSRHQESVCQPPPWNWAHSQTRCKSLRPHCLHALGVGVPEQLHLGGHFTCHEEWGFQCSEGRLSSVPCGSCPSRESCLGEPAALPGDAASHWGCSACPQLPARPFPVWPGSQPRPLPAGPCCPTGRAHRAEGTIGSWPIPPTLCPTGPWVSQCG